MGLIAGLVGLAGCAPPTDVISLQDVPQATRDAMLKVQILPLGSPAPDDAGSIGSVTGYGCGTTPVQANSDAVQQLQIKALRLQASAVAQVLVRSGPPCTLSYGAVATGIAVAPRGVPPTY